MISPVASGVIEIQNGIEFFRKPGFYNLEIDHILKLAPTWAIPKLLNFKAVIGCGTCQTILNAYPWSNQCDGALEKVMS